MILTGRFTQCLSILKGRDEVFIGRIRRDHSITNGLNMWIVADNLRKGAATNAVQIAAMMLENELIKV
jgi:aspartate-semialdehyde dehydrogenase